MLVILDPKNLSGIPQAAKPAHPVPSTNPPVTDPLLATKFFIPTVGTDNIRRAALLASIDDSVRRRCRLTLVSAPAGYGKSTLAAGWLQRFPAEGAPRAAWLALDERDNDPVRFGRCLLHALAAGDPAFGQETRAFLQLAPLPAAADLLCPLVNEIAAADLLRVVVLDDYHLIENETVHELVRFLVHSGPPQLHLVILSREDPPLGLPRLRARGQLTELRAAQLRFTGQEVGQFFGQLGIALQEDWARLLEQRSEGWPAALVLASLSLRSHEDPALFFARFGGDHRLVVDYLLDEVLDRLEPELRRFLLSCAVLQRFCAPLCQAVTGLGRAADLLRQAEAANLFLIPLDDRQVWFRYHHLFAGALLADLERTDPELIPVLHRRAADWFSENGQPGMAIEHALAGRDTARAVSIVRRWLDSFEAQGAYAELVGWFQGIPETTLLDDLPLSYRVMRVYFAAGDYPGSLRMRAAIENRLAGDASIPDETRRWLAVRILFDRAVFASMDMQLSEADAILAQAAGMVLPDDEIEQLQLAFYQGVNAAYQGRFAHALAAYQVCLEINLRHSRLRNAANCLSNMLEILCIQGKISEAIRAGEAFLQRYPAEMAVPGNAEALTSTLGVACYQANQLELAEEYLRRTIDSALKSGRDDNYGGWRLWLAAVCQALGKSAEADELIQKSEPWAAGFPGERFRLFAGAVRSRIRLAQGSLAEPRRWAGRFQAEIHETYFRDYEIHTLAWLWLVDGKAGQALELLQGHLAETEASEAGCYAVENLALQSLALAGLKRPAQALELLERSLSAAEQTGQVRTFINLGPSMQELLTLLRARRVLDPAAASMLDRLHAPIEGHHPSQTRRSILPGETISEREVEILRWMAAGLSNAQIAARMHLSLSTIKWYGYHLFGKLDVKNRTQAVARARELSLISS